MLQSKSDCKDIKFPIIIKDIHKMKICVGISVFDYENKEKYLLYMPKSIFKKHVKLLLLEKKKTKSTYMFLLKIFTHSSTIILYINFFILIVDNSTIVLQKTV